MNPQARKIWDALNPNIVVNSQCFRYMSEDWLTRVVSAIFQERGSIPSPKKCADVFRGSLTIVLAPDFPGEDIEEISVAGVRALFMRPVNLAWLVSRAADDRPPAGASAEQRLIDGLRAWQPRKVRA